MTGYKHISLLMGLAFVGVNCTDETPMKINEVQPSDDSASADRANADGSGVNGGGAGGSNSGSNNNGNGNSNGNGNGGGSGSPAATVNNIGEVLGGNGSDPINQVKALCQSLQVQNVVKQISFPKPTPTCAWGVDGNSSILNGQVRARREEYASLSIPDGAVLCDMSFSFPQMNMLYDDEIFLTYNGIILAASQDYSTDALHGTTVAFPNGMQKINGYLVYDWDRIKGSHYEHLYTPQYCLASSLGMGSCTIPDTEKTGTMQLSLQSDVVKRIGLLAGLSFENLSNGANDAAIAALAAAQKNKIGFITTGDNDNSDCIHNDFDFTVSFGYVMPQ